MDLKPIDSNALKTTSRSLSDILLEISEVAGEYFSLLSLVGSVVILGPNIKDQNIKSG
jgi:hypothetical protein